MRTGIPQALVGFLIGAVSFAGAELALSESPTLAHTIAPAELVELVGQPNSPAPKVAAPQSIGGGTVCPCPQPKYVRSSTSYTVAKGDTYVELDTDAGLPITVTLPAAPTPLERHEIWLGAQPGLPNGTVTIDPSGQATALFGGVDLVLDSANDGLVLLFVQPTPPPAGGYWRVSKL